MTPPPPPAPSSSPHVRQELLQLLLPVDGPKLEAARGVAGVADALVQGPVLVEGQTEAEKRQSGENHGLTGTSDKDNEKSPRRDRRQGRQGRILVFKGDPHAVDGQRVVVVLVPVVVS